MYQVTEHLKLADNVATILRESFSAHADRVALQLPESNMTYAELARASLSLAQHMAYGEKVGILSARSHGAYAGIVGAVFAGACYVPLNKRFPAERMLHIIDETDCNTLVIGAECLTQIEELLSQSNDLKLLYLDEEHNDQLKLLEKKFPQHRWIACKPSGGDSQHLPSNPPAPDSEIYILFTSGTTGKPKGIVVTHTNVCAYLANFFALYSINPEDKVSQLFDTSFDVSVHDIFTTLLAGACLCVIPEDAVMAPGNYIDAYGLTVWYSVPSVPMFMDKFRMLSEGRFPGIRLSFFAGEALPARTAALWHTACPNSRIANLYGPTEATIVVTNFELTDEHDPGQFENDVVPIGDALESAQLRILNEEGKSVSTGEAGELFIGGPQITRGYLNNQTLTEQKFVALEPGSTERWYRTGDLVKETKFGIEFIGRVDDQIQLRGFRVELAEIDRAIRKAVGHDLAIAVPVGLAGARADTVYAIIQGEKDRETKQRLSSYCKAHLPDYMSPSKIKFIDTMPLNINGKIDRKALIGLFSE